MVVLVEVIADRLPAAQRNFRAVERVLGIGIRMPSLRSRSSATTAASTPLLAPSVRMTCSLSAGMPSRRVMKSATAWRMNGMPALCEYAPVPDGC